MVEVRCSSAESVTAQSTDRSRGCSEASAQASTTLTATRKVGSGLQCAILNSSLAVFTSTIYPPKLPLTREQNAQFSPALTPSSQGDQVCCEIRLQTRSDPLQSARIVSNL